MVMQEIATIIRRDLKITVILINNGCYVIDELILNGEQQCFEKRLLTFNTFLNTVGPFNILQNWDYASLVDIFADGNPNSSGVRVTTANDLNEALVHRKENLGLSLIECVAAKEDCSLKLLEWGPRVAHSNMNHAGN